MKHMRVSEGFNVAFCGARGVQFTCIGKLCDCPECVRIRNDPERREKWRKNMQRQQAARRQKGLRWES